MQKYAQFEPGEVNGVRTVYQVIESELDPDGTSGEWVACGSNVGPRFTSADGGLIFSPPAPPAPVADPCEWLIDHGPLLDRFGTAAKMRFLKSTDPDVVALRQDFYGRKWLDLKNPELKGGFYFMAGVTVPVLGTIAAPITGLTTALVDTVFTTPVDPKDNQALRKLYF